MPLAQQLKKDLTSTHLREQAARLVRLTVVAFGAQVVALGQDHLGRDALVGAAVGAAEAAYRQWSPAVPWAQLASLLNLKEALGQTGQAGQVGRPAPPAPAAPPVPAPAAAGPASPGE